MAAIRQLLRSATSGSIDKALGKIARPPTRNVAAGRSDTIDLTDANWAESGDLTEDFDEKMSAFIAFDEDSPKSAQRWLEES